MILIQLSSSQQTDAFPWEVDIPIIVERFGRPEPCRTVKNRSDIRGKRECRVKSYRVWIKQWELCSHPFFFVAGGGSRDEGSIVLLKKPQNKQTLQDDQWIHYLMWESIDVIGQECIDDTLIVSDYG